MENQQQEKKSAMDKIWDEMTNISGPHYKAELKAGKLDLVPGFLGRVTSTSFHRPHPFEHDVTPIEPDLTTDDWTVAHD